MAFNEEQDEQMSDCEYWLGLYLNEQKFTTDILQSEVRKAFIAGFNTGVTFVEEENAKS